MHSAPAVSYPVGRSRFHAACLLLTATLGAATLLAWTLQADQANLRHGVSALLWLLCTALAVRHWQTTPTGLLCWDGTAWRWTCADETLPVSIEVTLDVQTVLLLRLEASSARHSGWVWPQQSTAPHHWLALRRAVHDLRPAAADLLPVPLPKGL